MDVSTAAYAAVWRLGTAVPVGVAAAVARAAVRLKLKSSSEASQLRRNLMRVVGAENVDAALVERSLLSYARYWIEAFRLPALVGDAAAKQDLLRRLDAAVVGREHLDASVASGRGVVLVLTHSGNWDMAGVWLVDHVGGFTTVAERLKPESLFRLFVDYRQSLGFEVLPLSGGPRPFPVLRERLAQGKVVCLLGERDFKGTGIGVDLLGEPTTLAAGPIALALQTRAALHVVDCHFTGELGAEGGWGFDISAPVDLDGGAAAVGQRVADLMGRNLRAHPEDWHALQPVWLADRPERAARRPGGSARGRA